MRCDVLVDLHQYRSDFNIVKIPAPKRLGGVGPMFYFLTLRLCIHFEGVNCVLTSSHFKAPDY